MTGTTNDQSVTFNYSPASQIDSLTKTNDAYAWTGHGSGSTASVANGLNQLTSIGGTASTHDSKGNLTTDPTNGKTYSYSSENLLTGASGGVTLGYDPQMRLYQVAGGTTTRFAYDGLAMIAEYDGSNALQRRFVHGPGIDEPLVKYEGSGTSNRNWLHADERGSIIALSDGSGSVSTINRYDEFGKPQATNSGRFQYTGQMWLSELGLYYYKARVYGPHIGRFWQTDPTGYDGGINLYGYVGNDSINMVDPLGDRGLYAAELRRFGLFFGPSFPLQGIQVVTGSIFGNSYTTLNTIHMSNRWGGAGRNYGRPQVGTRAAGVFAHELFHVYQMRYMGYQSSDFVALHVGHAALGADPYHYEIGPNSVFSNYNPEAQAQIVQRCFELGNSNSPECSLIAADPSLKFDMPDAVVTGNRPSTLADTIISNRAELFGPLNTIGLIQYLMKCIVGEVDICAGLPPPLAVDPREVPAD